MAKLSAKTIVENEIISKMEKEGKLFWQSPYFYIPKMNLNGKKYHGINRLLLAFCQDTFYLTMAQINSKNCRVKKGSSAEKVIYYNYMYFEKESGAKINLKDVSNYEDSEIKKIPFIKYYSVFGLTSIEDGEEKEKLLKELTEKYGDSINKKENENIENFLKNIQAEIDTSAVQQYAFYSPSKDKIFSSPKDFYKSSNEYYRTILHELVHWTGNVNRLDRSKESADDEEIIAEIGANILSHEFKIEDNNNTVAYVESWSENIKEKIKNIWFLYPKIEKAIKYLGL